MQYHHSRMEKGDSRPKNLENTTESGYGEMIYMEPSGNQMMSPVTEGRQTLRQSPGEVVSRSIVSTVKMNLRERADTAQLIGEKPIQSLVVAIPSRGIGEERLERSPKTINVGDTKEQTEYNIRTLNARKSPKGGLYQTYHNEGGNIGLDQPMQYSGFIQGIDGSYQMGNENNVVVTKYSKHSPGMIGQGNLIMNQRDGRDHLMNKMSPNQIDDNNSSQDRGYEPQVQWNNLKNVLGNQNRMNGSYDINNEKNVKETQIKYNNATYNNMTMGDVKNLVKRFTKVYDPRKTQEGALISQSQIIVPGANDEVFNGRYRVLQKMNRLSNILLSKRRGQMSPDKEDILNRSIEESKRTFDRHTLNRNTLKNGRMTISRSPEHKFLYVSLAMISSKGPNTEDRTILRKMRFDKGGVVDLAQEERKKGKYKIKKVQNKRGIRGASPLIRPNPKYREQAAKLIQAWWRELKELYKQRLNMIIKIQSFWRGRWVRKYMYDILYLSFMYQSFCQIIQKVLVKHIRPYIFDLLTEGEKNKNTILRNLLLKDSRWQILKLKPYLDRWIAYLRHTEVRNIRGRRLFDIRTEAEKRKEKLIKNFDKWAFLSKIHNLKNNAENASREKDQCLGIIKIFDGADKLSKKIALKNSKSRLLDYLLKKARNEKLTKIIKNKPDPKKQLLKKYLDKWLGKIKDDSQKDFKKRLSADLFDSVIKRLEKNIIRKSFNTLTRLPKRPEIVEKLIIQEKTIEKEAKIKGVNPELLNAGHLLENAILRLTYKYPLNAIDDKLNKDNKNEKLISMLNLKENYIKRILRDYLSKWLENCKNKENKELIRKIIMKLLNSVLKKIKNRILSNKFNQWKNNTKTITEDGENVYKKLKGLNNLFEKITKKTIGIYGKEFLDNLNKTRNKRVYKKALLKILDNYFNKDRNKLRTYLNKWKDQIRKMEIYDLKVKLIKNLANKNDNNIRRSRLNKALNKWLMNINIDKINENQSSENILKGKSDKKKFGALLITILKRLYNKNDKETLLRNIIKKWINNINGIKEKEKEKIKEGTNKLRKYNSIKNYNEFIQNLKEIFLKNLKNETLKKLLNKRTEGNRIKLLKNLLRWRNKITPIEKKDYSNYKVRYLKNIITKKNLEKLIRALYKWKSNIKPKTNDAPIKYGLNLLSKILKKNPFERIKKTERKQLKEIPKDLTLMEALLRGDLNSAKSLALKKIPLLHYFLKWRNIIRKENVNIAKREMFNKLFMNPLKRINKLPLRKYFNKWRDNIRKNNVKELKRNIYMKLMKNSYEKIRNNILKKKLTQWKNNSNKITKNIEDTKKALDNLRNNITKPIFEKTIIKEKKFPINSKLKSILISRFLSTKRNVLNKYLNKWKKILDKDKEDKIRNKILLILINHQDLKNKTSKTNKLKEALLKWKIKSAPKKENPLEKITNIRKGLEILEKRLRKPNLQNIFSGIKNRKKRIGGSKLISKIINKITPKVRKHILKKYFDQWRSKIPDTEKEKVKAKNIFYSILNNENLIKKQFEPYKDLAQILKEIYKLKSGKGKKIIDFFRKIKEKKKKKIIEERDLRLRNLLMKNNNKNLLRTSFAKWRRIIRYDKAIKDALIIRKFCKNKLNKINKKRNNINNFVNLIKKIILSRVLNKLLSGGKKRAISILLSKIIQNLQKGNKKVLKNNLLKWKNIIPLLQKINSAIKIQSSFRGMKVRKNKKKLNDTLSKLKLLVGKKYNSEFNLLRFYLLKWLQKAKKERYNDKVKIIQKYLRKRLTKLYKLESKKKLSDLLKKYYMKKVIEVLRRLRPIQKKNYDQIILLLDKLTKKRMKNVINKIKDYIKLKKLKNVYPKIIDALKKYFLPLYLRKWKIIAIDQKDKYIKIIQDFLRNKKANKKTKIKNRIDLILKILFMKNSESNKSKLKRYLWKWIKKAKEIELNEKAQIIQKFCKVHENKKLKAKSLNKSKLSLLLKRYLINQITNVLKEINDKYLKPIKKALDKVNGVDKRYATNNILNFANDTIRRQLLLYILNKQFKNNKEDLLRNYLNKWKNVTDKMNRDAIIIQNFVKKIKGKKQKKNMNKINQILLNLFMKNDSSKTDKLLYALRKWQLNTHLIKCHDKSNIIKKFIKRNLNKKFKNKIYLFYIKLAKKILAKKLKDLSKINKLRNSLMKIILKKLIRNGKEFGNSKKIINLLKKIILVNSKELKKKFLEKYLNIWRNKVKELKEKEDKSSNILQKFFKNLKNKTKKNRDSTKLDKLKKIILLMTRESPLRVAFNKFRSKIKRISVEENADIIKKFCKIVKKRKDKEKEQKLIINITKALEILSKINPYKKYAFDKIRKTKQYDGLKKIIDYIIKKRLDILKDVFNKIKKGKNKNKLLKLLKIKSNLRDKLLRDYLKKWKDKNDKLKRKRGAEKIQKNYKLYKNNKKKKGINELLSRLIKTKEERIKDKLKVTLRRWLKNSKLEHANNSAKKIQNYLNSKSNKNRAKKNWKKLSLILSKKNGIKKKLDVMKRLKDYINMIKFITLIKELTKKRILQDLLKKLKLRKLLNLLKLIFTKFSDRNKTLLLKRYLNKWREKSNKLKKIEEILKKMVEDIDTRRKIIAAKTIGDVFLIKKLFHDILRIRALEFLKRLKNSGELKKRLRALGDTLVKTKKDLDNKNKEIFLKKLYKVYYLRALDKLIRKIKEKQKAIKKKYEKYFFNILKKINLQHSEKKSQSSHQGSNNIQNTRLQFRAHFSSPKAVTKQDKNTYLYILPLFIEFLKNKIKERKEWSFKKILNKDKYNNFCRLIKNYIMKKQLPNKKEFLNALMEKYRNLKTKGPLLNKLYKLLHSYIINKWMKVLKDASKLYKIFYLFKMTFMHKGITERRFIREIIRKWRFTTFVKIMAKRKLELMYKNLHVSYLQMANEVFGDEDSTYNASVVKEFERFGNDVGMWGNENPYFPSENGLVKTVNKKYVFESLDNENMKLFEGYNIDLDVKKNIVVSDIHEDVKIENLEISEKEKESFKRKKKDEKEKEEEKEKEKENENEGNLRGRKIRTYEKKKDDEGNEGKNKKKNTYQTHRKSEK